VFLTSLRKTSDDTALNQRTHSAADAPRLQNGRRRPLERPRGGTLDAMDVSPPALQHVPPRGFQKVRHYGSWIQKGHAIERCGGWSRCIKGDIESSRTTDGARPRLRHVRPRMWRSATDLRIRATTRESAVFDTSYPDGRGDESDYRSVPAHLAKRGRSAVCAKVEFSSGCGRRGANLLPRDPLNHENHDASEHQPPPF